MADENLTELVGPIRVTPAEVEWLRQLWANRVSQDDVFTWILLVRLAGALPVSAEGVSS